MLDSDRKGFTDTSFSSAGDIVELVIFTQDEVFLQTLREAVGDTRRLWHVLSADKVGDLLVAGQVGILVLDVQALAEPASAVITRIKLQFPELVVIVAGHREAEGSLASLISSGTVYRFIHKPVSPARAKLFIDAAVRKRAEHHKPAPTQAVRRPGRGSMRMLLIPVVVVLVAIAGGIIWLRESTPPAPPPRQSASRASADEGIAAAQERLLAHIESALLEDRLDDAAASIDAARKAGVEGGRIAFLTAQLARSREQLKAATAQAKARLDSRGGDAATPAISPAEAPSAVAPASPLTALLSLAAERIKQGRLIQPEADNAVQYVKQATRIDPDGNATQAARQTLSSALLTDLHSSLERRDFARAGALLAAAEGIVAPANLASSRQLLATAQQQADATTRDQLLKTALDRVHQDRLVEPANDSAKYYLLRLRDADPGNAGLSLVVQELGLRLLARARQDQLAGDYQAARGALDEASAVGYSSTDLSAVRSQVDAAETQQRLNANIVDVGQLKVLKSVNPVYPQRAKADNTEGWVEVDFTVQVTGTVSDVAVHASSPPSIFDQAAVSALSKWRFQPVVRDGKPEPQRARIRIRFALSG